MRMITFELPALLVFGIPFLLIVTAVAHARERWMRRRIRVRDATAIQEAVEKQTRTQWRNPFRMYGVVSYVISYEDTHYFAHLDDPRHPVFYAVDTSTGKIHKITAVVDHGTWLDARLTVLDLGQAGAVFDERHRVDAGVWNEARTAYLSLIPQ